MKNAILSSRTLLLQLALGLLVITPCQLIQAQHARVDLQITRNDGRPGGVVEVDLLASTVGIHPDTVFAAATLPVTYDPLCLKPQSVLFGAITDFNVAWFEECISLAEDAGSCSQVPYHSVSDDIWWGAYPYVQLTIYGLVYSDSRPSAADWLFVGENPVHVGTIRFLILDSLPLETTELALDSHTALGFMSSDHTLFVSRVGVESFHPYDTRWLMPFVSNGPVEVSFEIGEGTLPVELIRLSAEQVQRAVLLSWTTASETNNAGFHVELELEERFETIGFVEGAGTSTEENLYSFKVEDLLPGTHRFRLRQIDYDGSVTYSDIIEIRLELVGRFELSPVYPNPFGRQAAMDLVVARDQNVSVTLVNQLGQTVRRLFDGTLMADKRHRLDIRREGLASGLYVCRVSGDYFEETRTIIVQ